MKYIIALFIFLSFFYTIPSYSFGDGYPVVGQLQTTIKDQVSVVLDQQCGAQNKGAPIACSGYHDHYSLYHGIGRIMFRPWGPSTNECFGVKVYSADAGSRHQCVPGLAG